jgi:hypothetical protein
MKDPANREFVAKHNYAGNEKAWKYADNSKQSILTYWKKTDGAFDDMPN